MIIGKFAEEFIQRVANVHAVLNQTFRAYIGLTNFALCLITADKPVVANRFCILLFCLFDTFGRLLLEAIKLALAYGILALTSRFLIAILLLG
jgi:hypothetical protein